MVRVEFLGPIGKDGIELDVENVEQLAKHLKQDKDMNAWLDISALAVNDVLVSSKSCKLNDGDRVSILPPVCGG